MVLEGVRSERGIEVYSKEWMQYREEIKAQAVKEKSRSN
jgi:hypothetical protein